MTSSLKKRSKQESEELNMGNTIAMILGNERSRTTPDFIRGSRIRRREEFEAAENGRDMAVKREVRAIMAAIDKELGNYQSLAELDFRAGFVTGKIYEKEAAGLITPGYRVELIRILYAKYETIRDLESEGV